MSWEEVSFETLYAIPSKNGLNRPSRVRGKGHKMINMGELFAHDRIGDIDMELVPLNENELSNMLVQEGDLLFARQSLVLAGAGKCSIVKKTNGPTTFESHIIRVRLRNDQANSFFYHYYFKSPACRIRSIVTQGVQAGIRGNDLKKLSVHRPPLVTQQRIASILSAYDNLIENNRRRIQLLEQAARLLYKEWFVHLRFPGYEQVKIKNGVPEGWEKKTVSGVCSEFVDGDWIETKDQGGDDLRLLQISNIGENEFVETGNFRFITEDTFRNLHCTEIRPGDLLLSRMPKPIGRAWMVTEMPWRMVTAVDITIARPDSDQVDPFYYLYHLNSDVHLGLCAARATGATRPRISRKNMGSLPIVLAPMTLQREFGAFSEDIHKQKATLRRQLDILAQARDLLLPRLMNGEIAL